MGVSKEGSYKRNRLHAVKKKEKKKSFAAHTQRVAKEKFALK